MGSSRRDLHRRVGGSCSSHNMKVIFKVAEQREEVARTAVQRQPTINRPRNSEEAATERKEMENVRPISRVSSFHTGLDIAKKTGETGQNVIKQKASTMSCSSCLSPILTLLFFVSFLRLTCV